MRHIQVFVGALALLIAIAAGLGGLSRDVLDVGTWPALQEERDREPEVLPHDARSTPPAGERRERGRDRVAGSRRGATGPRDAGSSARGDTGRVTLRVRRGGSSQGPGPSGRSGVPALGPADTDRDGLADRSERRRGTSFVRADSDSDTMPDGWEVAYLLDPLRPADAAADSDGDGLTNRTEFRVAANPRSVDTDSDGRMDGRDDRDRDGVPNLVEQAMAMDPADPDSDHDGHADGAEDPDGDGLPTAVETTMLLDPTTAVTGGEVADGALDSDGDGVANAPEIQAGTNPGIPDAPPPDPAAVPDPEPGPEPPASGAPQADEGDPPAPEPAPVDPG